MKNITKVKILWFFLKWFGFKIESGKCIENYATYFKFFPPFFKYHKKRIFIIVPDEETII